MSAALKLYTPERVVEALTTGVMSTQGIPLSKQDKQDVAYFLTGKQVAQTDTAPLTKLWCRAGNVEPQAEGASWNGWGNDLHNSRFQAGENRLSKATVSDLELSWAFAFSQTTRVRSQPTVIGNTLYIGSQEGQVYAIDLDSGCTHWIYQADAEVRGGIHVQTDPKGLAKTLYFGDFKAQAYAVSATTGELIWKTRVREHPMATLTGSVSVTKDLVLVPTSSSEVIPAAREDYSCCSFRGALVALDKRTGEQRWVSYTTEAPKPTYENAKGVMQQGPSGAPIWSRPAVDEKRGVVYVTTGQNYSTPATVTSDAVIALSLFDGKQRWVTQVTKGDAWNGGCVRQNSNCPRENGPDFDIGTGALLATHSDGRDVLLIGQKSGMVFAMDPDTDGAVLWQTRVGSGGTMGGVHWGLAADDKRVFVGVSDLPTNNPYTVGDPYPGVVSLDLLSGEILWRQVLPDTCPKGVAFRCFAGISAAVSASPGLVFAGGMDGLLRAFDALTGEVLWSYNTWRDFQGINGIKGNGGAIEADGPVILNGQVLVTSGYDKWGEIPGNVLLKFALPKQAESGR